MQFPEEETWNYDPAPDEASSESADAELLEEEDDETEYPDEVPCAKCDGAGWIAWHEIDDATGLEHDYSDSDNTRVHCDLCGGAGMVPVE